MPTIIDSLVVTLGLDSSKFDSGSEDAETKSKKLQESLHSRARQISSDGTLAASFFGKMKSEALSFLTVVLGTYGLAEFTRRTIEGNAAVGSLSRTMGVSTQALSSWEGAVKQAGGSAAQAAQDMQRLISIRDDFIHGLPMDQGVAQVLSRLNLSSSALRDPVEFMRLLNQRFQGRTDTAFLGRQLGLSREGTDALSRSTVEYNRALAESSHLTREQTNAAEDAHKEISVLGEQVHDLGTIILGDLLPYLKPLTSFLGELVAWGGRHPEAVLAALGVAGVGAALGLVKAAADVLGLANSLTALATANTALQASEAGAGLGLAGLGLLGGAGLVIGGAGSVAITAGLDNDRFNAIAGNINAASPADLEWARKYMREHLEAINPGPAGESAKRSLMDRFGPIMTAINGRLGPEYAGGTGISPAEVSPPAPPPAATPAPPPAAARTAGGGARPSATTPWPGRRGQRDELALGTEAYLREHGIAAGTAHGIAAGQFAEGGSLGMADNGAFGIGQWRGPRKAELFRRYGQNPTLEQQREFLLWELRGGDPGGASVLAQSDSAAAQRYYVGGAGWGFMRPDRPGHPGEGSRGDNERADAWRLRMGPTPGLASAGPSTNSRTANTNVGTVIINTQATDARGIAKDFQGELARTATQANSGLM